MVVRFGTFAFDTASGLLTRDGAAVKVQPQPAKVLAVLVERAGEVVTRDELRERIWGTETYVDFERGLNFCVSQIRAALGDSAEAPRFIETVPKRGYRFVAGIDAPAPPNAHPGAALVVLSVVVLAAVVFAAGRPWAGVDAPARIAVAQFDNETGDPALDSVATGVSDAAVARLAAAELLPRIAVIGNAPILRQARSFRDVKRIGETLGVEYVILGQLKRDQQRTRLIAHFIRVSDEAHLWANTFDRPAFDLAVQAELADTIARSVAERLNSVKGR